MESSNGKLIVTCVASSALTAVITYAILRSRTSKTDFEAIAKKLDMLRSDIEQLRVDIATTASSAIPKRSSQKVLTFDPASTKSCLSRSKSTTSVASSDGEFADAAEEWINGTVTVASNSDPKKAITVPSISFADVDVLFGTDNVHQGYKSLKTSYDDGLKSDAELLWRLAKTCHEMACRTADKEKKKALFLEGAKYGDEAVIANTSNFMALKWAAILTGQITDYLGTKEKIEVGAKFKDYLDKAIALDDKEFSLFHMRGRYAYSVAGLSWVERKLASALFATPPTATYDEALADFLAAYEQRKEWIENLLYIGRVYLERKDKASAAKYLQEALEIKPAEDRERELLQECSKLLAKC